MIHAPPLPMHGTALSVLRQSRRPRAGWMTCALCTLCALGALAAVIAVAAWTAVVRGELIDTGRFARPDDAVTVVDRHGRVLRHARVQGADRRWVPLREVSPAFLSAVIAAEDRNFLRHHGVDARAIVRSTVRDLLPWNRLSGASTLTQQLVKLVYGRRSGLGGKAVEALRALSLERVFSKDEILEQYMNRVPYGDGIQGVSRASEEYLGHPAATLTVAESALLAGIPQAPSVTEPRRHLDRALRRRDQILGRMLANGAIDRPAYDAALRELPAIRLAPARPWEAARFADAVLAGWQAGTVRRMGGVIPTSLDLGLQHRAESLLVAQLDRLASRGARNGAAVVVANATGEVLAYVGAARDDAEANGGALDLLRARRQPGSTLKPFVYELLFERGGTAATVLDDVASTLHGARGSSFEARDYDGHERGPVRARVALSASLNLAALEAARRVGPDALVTRLRALGFQPGDDPSRYGAAVVLGGADITALQLSDAWVTLARGGTSIPLTLSPGAPVHPLHPRQVMAPAAARVAWDILSDGAARADAFGEDLVDAAGGRPFALKTGTSTGWRDAWAAVADERTTVVVWLGDPAGNPMAAVSGFEAAAPVAARILAAARAMTDGPEAVVPPAVPWVEADVCAWSGLRVGPRCRHVVHERFAPGTAPTARCEAHDASGAWLLPPRLAAWAERTHPAGVRTDPHAVAADAAPAVVEPPDGARWLLDPGRGDTAVDLRATLRGIPTGDLSWEIDGVPQTTARWTARVGRHVFVAVRHGLRSPAVTLDVGLPGTR